MQHVQLTVEITNLMHELPFRPDVLANGSGCTNFRAWIIIPALTNLLPRPKS
jgi:hypothetical protein